MRLLFYRRRKAAPALAWGAAIFLLELFVIIVNGYLLNTLTYYLAIAVASAAAAIIALAVYLSEPKLWRARYRIIIEVSDQMRDRKEALMEFSPLDRAIISESIEKGYMVPADLARELGTTVYSVVERVCELEREGRIKVLRTEAIE